MTENSHEPKSVHDQDTGAEMPSKSDDGDPYFLAALRSPYYVATESTPRVDYRIEHVRIDEDWNDIDFLRLEVLRLRDEVIGALAREGEARAQLDGLLHSESRMLEHLSITNHASVVAQLKDSEERVEAILRSKSWRLASFLLLPARTIRKIFTRATPDKA